MFFNIDVLKFVQHILSQPSNSKIAISIILKDDLKNDFFCKLSITSNILTFVSICKGYLEDLVLGDPQDDTEDFWQNVLDHQVCFWKMKEFVFILKYTNNISFYIRNEFSFFQQLVLRALTVGIHTLSLLFIIIIECINFLNPLKGKVCMNFMNCKS